MNNLADHRDRIAAAQRAAKQAVRDLWLDLDNGLYNPDHAIVADLIRNAPDAVRAACERLSNKETST